MFYLCSLCITFKISDSQHLFIMQLFLKTKLHMTKRNGPTPGYAFYFLPSVVIASTRGHIRVVVHAARPPQQIPIFNRSLVTGLKTPCRKCCLTTRRISLIMTMMEMWISSPLPVVCRIPITYLVCRRIKDPPNLDRLEEVNEVRGFFLSYISGGWLKVRFDEPLKKIVAW